MDMIPQLPRDLIANILSRLPVKYLVQLKCVCKPWQSLITDPQFARLQLSQSKNNGSNCDRLLSITDPLGSVGCEVFDGHDHGLDHVNHHKYPSVMNNHVPLGFELYAYDLQIRGSSDGLICVSFDNGLIFLWNRTMGEALELPNIGDFNPLNVIYGLCYDSSIDDYKLLGGRCHPLEGNYHFEVLALKSNICRNIEVEECNFDYNFHEKPGIFFRGRLHWIPHSPCYSKITPVILSFDIVEEKFCKLVEVPDGIEKTNIDMILKKSEDSFVLFCADYLRCDLVAWRLNEYGVKSSWTKIFRKYICVIPSFLHWWRVVHYTETGKVIFDYGDNSLICYNPEDDSWKMVSVEWFESGIYVESLISPYWYRPTSA